VLVAASVRCGGNGFLTEDLLRHARPAAAADMGRDVTMAAVLDAAALEIDAAADRRFGDLPLVEARIRCTIGRTYTALGRSAARRSRAHAGSWGPGTPTRWAASSGWRA